MERGRVEMEVIKVENATKVFKNIKALDEVSISCKQGEIVGIVGHNGSGKTVLFKSICGFFTLDEGEIYINGKKRNRGEILILDEPMNGLDHNGVAEMRKIFLELKKQGITMLLASHNKEDIDILCDKVYVMSQGKIIQQ